MKEEQGNGSEGPFKQQLVAHYCATLSTEGLRAVTWRSQLILQLTKKWSDNNCINLTTSPVTSIIYCKRLVD